MGYWISKLQHLPTNFEWYFFLIGDYRSKSFVNDLFRDDFQIIADRLDEQSAIIARNRSIEDSLQQSLKDVERGKLGRMLHDLEDNSPGLLILNKHPHKLYHFNEFMENARNSIPLGLNDRETRDYLVSIYNKSRCEHDNLTGDDIIVYIPFETLEKAYESTNSLLVDLVAFSKGKNKDLLHKTSKLGIIKNHIDTSVSLNLGIIAINIDL